MALQNKIAFRHASHPNGIETTSTPIHRFYARPVAGHADLEISIRFLLALPMLFMTAAIANAEGLDGNPIDGRFDIGAHRLGLRASGPLDRQHGEVTSHDRFEEVLPTYRSQPR